MINKIKYKFNLAFFKKGIIKSSSVRNFNGKAIISDILWNLNVTALSELNRKLSDRNKDILYLNKRLERIIYLEKDKIFLNKSKIFSDIDWLLLWTNRDLAHISELLSTIYWYLK